MQEVGPLRKALIEQVGKCEFCGASPRKRLRTYPPEMSELCVHEVANGPLRAKALDKRYATLVLCVRCNGAFCDKAKYTEARQLHILHKSRPDDYDLVAYSALVGHSPNRIEQHEVDVWGIS